MYLYMYVRYITKLMLKDMKEHRQEIITENQRKSEGSIKYIKDHRNMMKSLPPKIKKSI